MKFFILIAVSFLIVCGCAKDEPVTSEEPLSSELVVEFDTAPKPTKTFEPEYPDEARRAGVSGTVRVEILVDEFGVVQSAEVLDSSNHTNLDEAAKAAAAKWLFEPAQLNGRSVPAKLVIPFKFALQ